MPYTLCAFHAHPDDEALLTSGTLARAAAEGHRVIVVTATDGDLGLTSADYRRPDAAPLGHHRLQELLESCRALHVARVEWLGYADSGSGPEIAPPAPGLERFAAADVDEAAGRLARILREESVDVLLTYDANGGYGHRDHVQVHHVGARAAELAGTPRVLQATAPRDLLCRALDVVSTFYTFPSYFDRASFDRAYSASADITHRISVRPFVAAKRASMRAHASQAASDGAERTLAAFLRIPRPVYDWVFGREWYVDPARPAGAPVATDVFEGLP
ncbi:PIG-L family deacetylase [Arsenicicoccus dermatophilus]|uniref:PIG-L family deacetylase n=1 Tax=Arsenicicoccus dermatophilus TaxID=1076331 RepID=UPI001F4C7B7C|nr:PIG-L family deacetylase [Arsenicicoccus dermatophilus]MCH8612209.1 PIG-L family deacetylase [Arsenicicoccus dermatophilus]